MSKFRDFFNEVTNDGRIFSYEDVINIPKEEAQFYQEALDYQYGKIGFPKEKELRKSVDVSEIASYTYSDGSVTRAHFRSNGGEQFIDSKKPFMTTPSMEKKRINEFIDKTSKKKVMNIDKANNKSQESPTFEIGIEYNEKPTYRWKTNKGACDKCKELDNKKFESKEDIPPKPHPNCKCEVEIIKNNSERCDCIDNALKEIDDIINNATVLEKEININISKFSKLLLNRPANRFLITSLNNCINGLEQIKGAVNDFIQNYKDMKEANTIGADKYFHSKANCDAAKRGEIGALVAKGISDLREFTDTFKNVLFKGMTLAESIKDSIEDQEANKYGREQGRNNPNEDSSILIDKYRPNGLPDRY